MYDMDFFDYMMAALALAMFLIGIASLVGFFITGMWHCLLLAGMAFGMVGIWYHEDIHPKLSELWQKKNTEK